MAQVKCGYRRIPSRCTTVFGQFDTPRSGGIAQYTTANEAIVYYFLFPQKAVRCVSRIEFQLRNGPVSWKYHVEALVCKRTGKEGYACCQGILKMMPRSRPERNKDAIDAVPAKGYSNFGATFTVCFG